MSMKLCVTIQMKGIEQYFQSCLNLHVSQSEIWDHFELLLVNYLAVLKGLYE